jgi:hypothetical protein
MIHLISSSEGSQDKTKGRESFLRRQNQASRLFNLSVTINQESQSDAEKRKALILSKKLKEKVSPSCLLSTLSQILHLSGASKLLGSSYNHRSFLKFIRKSVVLGGMRSALQLGQLVSSLKPEHCKWLEPIDDPVMKVHIFVKAVAWFFSEYVLPLLKIGFYVTETSGSRFQLEFYFRDTWRSLSDRLRDRFIKKGKLGQRSSTQNFGNPTTGTLRLIPKPKDLRPILALRNNT